jgi:chaperone BCS1
MESVAMPAEQKNRIVEDLRTFLAAEDHYNRLAIPWHRGYMFHGPPGTGKTSLVKGLACEFNLDLWYISLSDLNAESSLLALLAEVGPRSLLLLEDIDTARITHDRDGADQGKISMSSLLNTLDGVATPHGLITVMTTNRFDILDPALTRVGRMDLVEELGCPLRSTIDSMYKHFYGQNLVWPAGHRRKDVIFKGTSTAQISEVFKRNMTDAKGGTKALMELLKVEEKRYS